MERMQRYFSARNFNFEPQEPDLLLWVNMIPNKSKNNKLNKTNKTNKTIKHKKTGVKNNNKTHPLRRELRVSAPAVAGFINHAQKPKMVWTTKDACVIEHTELFDTIAKSSTVETASGYRINPGAIGTFPWLASVARNFESYEFEKLSFIFETVTSTNQTGDVHLCIDYDSADAAPVDILEMAANATYANGPVWSTVPIRVDFVPSNIVPSGKKFVSGVDSVSPTTDAGRFYVRTGVSGSGGNAGRLTVQYRVKLIAPKFDTGDEAPASIEFAATPPISTVLPFGTSATVINNNIVRDAGNRLTFYATGRYLLSYFSDSGTSLTTGYSISGTDLSISPIESIINGAATALAITFEVTVSAVGAYLLMTLGSGNYAQSTVNVGKYAEYYTPLLPAASNLSKFFTKEESIPGQIRKYTIRDNKVESMTIERAPPKNYLVDNRGVRRTFYLPKPAPEQLWLQSLELSDRKDPHPSEDSDFDEVKSQQPIDKTTNKLSQSVVDLITSKLRN